MVIREGFTFDDVLLVPKFSDITSRSQTNLSTNLSRNIKLNIPLVSANMDTVTESTMATTMARQGGIGIIHRFLTIEEEAEQVLKVKRSGSVMIDNPYQISSEKSVEEAIDLMNEKEVSGLLIIDSDSKLVGVLTERDVLFESINSKKSVSELMTKDVISSNENTTLDEAKDILKSHRVEKLPLVNDKNQIVGLYTTQDILNIENFPNASKDKKGRPLVGAAVGVKGDFLDRTEALLGAGADAIAVSYTHLTLPTILRV